MKSSNFIYYYFGAGVFFLLLTFGVFIGCQKTDHPLGLNAPLGIDRPTLTPTPSTGAFNCYVYDNGGKQGVTVVLLDPSLSNAVTNETDQFGNAVFNPSPLVVGVYTAEVLAQGRYGLSALPITITSPSQGAVSCTFTATSQALTIVSGAPASFVAGNGSFNIGVSYIQPGSLDVPITVTTNALPSSWNTSPSPFVLSMANPTTIVAVNKTGCAVLNQPVTFTGNDFLGTTLVLAYTTLIRNFPINVQVQLSEQASTCNCVGGTCRSTLDYFFKFVSPSDCGQSWTLTVGSRAFTVVNGQSVTVSTGSTTGCKSIGTSTSASISSVIGTAPGSGSSGSIINTNF